MGTVIFVPGLQGLHALENQSPMPLESTNEFVLRQAASNLAWDFKKVVYQHPEEPYPTLAAMEEAFAAAFSDIDSNNRRQPILVVASSVGFGVALGGLARLRSSISPFSLLGFKPVPDPLLAIGLQLPAPALNALKSGQIKNIPLPVEANATDTAPGSFSLTLAHLNDQNAHRFLTNPASRNEFNMMAGGKLDECVVIYSMGDHLTPSTHIRAFCSAVSGVQPQEILVEGNHKADSRATLHDTSVNMMKRLDFAG